MLSPGGPAALRLTPPGPRAAAELRALRFWAGGPVVGVLQSSPDGSVLLLERLDPSRSLAGEPVERVAAVAGELVARLALPGPPADVPATADTARALAATAQARWAALGAPGERWWIEAAVAHAITSALAPCREGPSGTSPQVASARPASAGRPWSQAAPASSCHQRGSRRKDSGTSIVCTRCIMRVNGAGHACATCVTVRSQTFDSDATEGNTWGQAH